jgi:hypothetical protein
MAQVKQAWANQKKKLDRPLPVITEVGHGQAAAAGRARYVMMAGEVFGPEGGTRSWRSAWEIIR